MSLVVINTAANQKIIGILSFEDDETLILENPMCFESRIINEGLVLLMERYEMTSTETQFFFSNIISIDYNASTILTEHYYYKLKLYQQLLDESYEFVVTQQTTSLSSLFNSEGLLSEKVINESKLSDSKVSNVIDFSTKLH